MTNQYVTNPTVRAFLARELKHDRDQLNRHKDQRTRDFFREEYQHRMEGYRLMAIGLQGWLERGQLKASAQ